MNEQVRILIVDDHPLFRDGVVRTLRAEPEINIVGEATTAAQAIHCATELMPDVVLLEVRIPGGGLNAADAIAARAPHIKIVVLTASEAEQDVITALKVGVRGYILKGVSGQELVRALRGVCAGESYVTPTLAVRMLTADRFGLSQHDCPIHPPNGLTRREHEILREVAAGLSNKEIARRLALSEQTVKHYVTNIFQKLHVRNRVEAALLAHNGGLVKLPEKEYKI